MVEQPPCRRFPGTAPSRPASPGRRRRRQRAPHQHRCAPSPTILVMASCGSGAAPSSASSSLAESARSRDGIDQRAVEIEHDQAAEYVARCDGRRLPDRDAHDGQTLLARDVEDQPRDPFDGRIAVEQIDRLAERLQRRDERIVVPQHHLVIELAIDPALDDALDVAEIADHVAVVERVGAHLDLRDRVVAVRMLADAVVVEQAMPVTEVDALGDRVHTR